MQLVANCRALSGDVKVEISVRMPCYRVGVAVDRKIGQAADILRIW